MFSRLCISGRSCSAASGERGENTDCSAAESLLQTLLDHFHFSAFRPGQLDALIPLVHGRDVFVRMATGAGKSLCIYLGPLAAGTKALAVVISPLNGLMEQQVQELKDLGITAIRVRSDSSFDKVAAGEYRFVFMSPEIAVSRRWRGLFETATFKKRLVMVAVDEAHCIPEWGSDFRIRFSEIGGLRALTDVPFMALTASATPQAQNDIVNSLGMLSPAVVSQTLDRANIFLSASKLYSLSKELGGLISSLSSCEPLQTPKTIVFCRTKDSACKVYTILHKAARLKHTVSMYHASLTTTTKSFIQRAFQSTSSELRCLVATVAFGMGMNIPDVELVIVYGVPDTIAQFYQLCGRSGRSGNPSRAHLIYSPKAAVKDPALQLYCKAQGCRRSVLLRGLGSNEQYTVDPQKCCDVCSASCPYARIDILKPVRANRKRHLKVREINEELKDELHSKLVEERNAILNEHPGFKMIGANFLCPDSMLDELCTRASYMTSVHDLDILCLRPQFRDRFYKVISTCVSSAPPPQRKRRKRV